jgi:hypothetical protein
MSTFPQPGEVEAMAAEVTPPWTDKCVILTYGESPDLDGSPLIVFSAGDEIACVWEAVKVTEVPGERFSVTTAEWKVMVAPDTPVTRRDMVRLTARFGARLTQPHEGAVWGDPEPDLGSLTVHVREIAQ